MRRGILLSLTLHAALAMVLIAGVWLWPGQGPREPVVLAEVELVEQNTPAVGSAAAAMPEQPATRPAAGRAQPSHAAPAPSMPSALNPPLPLPPPRAPPVPPRAGATAQPAPAPPAAPLQAAQPAATSLRVGEPDSIGTGLVSGSQVIPAELDQAVRNAPPAYPRRAVRGGEQGSVILSVHIGADGSATAVDIYRSSGYGLLDQAARSAVEHWHFVAAREAGAAVSSTMLFKIRFLLTNPGGSQ